MVTQAGLLLTIIVGTGLALASAVVALLPPRDLRQGLAEGRQALADAEKSLQQDSTTLQREDLEWQNRRAELVGKAQEARHAQLAQAQSALHNDEAAISQSPQAAQVLSTLKNFFATNSGEYALEQAKTFINRIPALDETDAKNLVAYCEHWTQLTSLSSRGQKSDDEIRAEAQPDHDHVAQKVTSETAQVPQLRANVEELQKQVNDSYNPGHAVLTLVSFAFCLIFYVWGIGVLIEVFSMAIYISNDVKQIRLQSSSSAVYR